MDKVVLKGIVLEQKKYLGTLDLGVPREALKVIENYARLPHTVLISGMRRTGKSTLLAQIADRFYGRDVYYFNFEDERLLNFEPSDFNHLYEVFLELFGTRKIFFFDEIQNAPKWELFIRRMQEAGNKFFITGSNASLLSRELGTRLTGRNVVLELYPFSFREFLEMNKVQFEAPMLLETSGRALVKKHFQDYLERGGVPEYCKYRDPVVLKRIYDDILYRDIVSRHDIKEVKALRELGLYLLSNVTTMFSFNNLKQILGLGSMNTVRSYINYLEDSFLISMTNRFSYSLKKQFVANKKCYSIDNGLISAIAFQFSANRGKYLENLVFGELKRREQDVFYFQTKSKKAVDFLVKRGKKGLALIQVTESLAEPAVRKRETGALTEAINELGAVNVLILTRDTEEQFKIGKCRVKIQPVYQWLLEGHAE